MRKSLAPLCAGVTIVLLAAAWYFADVNSIFSVSSAVQEPAPLSMVNRGAKKSQLKAVIYIADGANGGELTPPFDSRQRAEAELASLYPDADAIVLVEDGRGNYIAPSPTPVAGAIVANR